MKDDYTVEEQQEKESREGGQEPATFTDRLIDLQRVLTSDDIDFRVGRSGLKGQMGWATLLAYKDARVDMKRLDEVFGGEWSNTYKRDTKGTLQCEISIYNRDLSQWVSRSSAGVPSQFESEKGEYSDAFKRAGFMWGIGRELYDFPDLFVELLSDEFRVYEPQGKKPEMKVTYKFDPNEWEWKIDWDHVNNSRRTGLIWAKGKGSSSYRVKPKALISHHKAEVIK